ncbi:MAG: ATP-binding protein [Bacteroidales bacterium]
MVERQHQQTIIKLLNHFPVVAIIGPRQVGKTTLAKKIIPILKNEVVYLDLESPSDLNKLQNAELYFDLNKDKCIIIDEIQRNPELFPVLRTAVDKHRTKGRFILLGSASPDLLKNTSESLAGRIVYVELTGLNFKEVNQKIKYTTHWIRGGFPEPLFIKENDIRKEWYRSFIRTYIEKDLRLLGLSTSPVMLNRFISMLANNQGTIWNATTYSKALGVSVPTINNCIDYFENAFLVRRLQPYYQNTNKRLIKSPKMYLRDSGILHYLAGIEDIEQLMGNTLVGTSWENYIIEQISSVLGNNYRYYYYRTQDGTECDMVLTKNQKPLSCIEIKFSQSPSKTKSLTFAINDLVTKNNFIIIPECKEAYPLDKNITVCDLGYFLKNWQNN